MGYRCFEARRSPVRFPFGHGLSYTTFEIGAPRCRQRAGGAAGHAHRARHQHRVARGSEVVQCYVAPPPAQVVRPPKELKAFAKVTLDPASRRPSTSSSTTARSPTGTRATPLGLAPAGTDVGRHRSRAEYRPTTTEPGWQRRCRGEYTLQVGRSSADIAHAAPIRVG